MSVLLDALKQAAAEKKQRDALAADQLISQTDGHGDTHGKLIEQQEDNDQTKSQSLGSSPTLKKDDALDHPSGFDVDPQSLYEPESNDEDDVIFSSEESHKDDVVEQKAVDSENNLDTVLESEKHKSPILSLQDIDDKKSNVSDDKTSESIESGGVLFSSSSDESLHADQANGIEVSQATEDVSLDDIVLWDNSPETVEEEQEESLESQSIEEPVIVKDPEEEKRKYKAAVDQINNLRHQEIGRKRRSKILWMLAMMLIFSVFMMVYFFFSAKQTQEKISIKDDFSEFVDMIESHESLVNNALSDDSKSIAITNTLSQLSDNKVTSPADILETSAVLKDVVGLQQDESLANDQLNIVDILKELKAESLALEQENTVDPVSLSLSDQQAPLDNSIASSKSIRLGKVSAPSDFRLISDAYAAYQGGQFDTAESLYLQALAISENNRDALLGIAAVAMRKNRQQDALLYYQRVLEISPQDSFAQAGLMTLQSRNINDPRWLTKINQLLLSDPKASHLHFLKANAHAVNGRWEAAQKSYFEAWSHAQDNPDYAYNLAISLDQLGQKEAALTYYLTARRLSLTSPNNIVISRLEKRVSQLEGAADVN